MLRPLAEFRRVRVPVVLVVCVVVSGLVAPTAWAQAQFTADGGKGDPKLGEALAPLRAAIAELEKNERLDRRHLADVAVYAKAVEWCLRHDEFYSPKYGEYAEKAIATGLARAKELAEGKPSWLHRPGTTIRGYVSKVDGSVQPYALTLPEGIDPGSADRWPLHVVLHGRGATLNEVSFIHQHDGKPLPKDELYTESPWVQLDVFGRTNNAYRWAGETDVFEAIADLRRTVRIDERRIVLRGFSMGGAGAWHLGLHHPSKWCSVGPGAGFVDFYKYQKVKEPLPEHQHLPLRIYDAVEYARNAFNVPVCTYGGELDAQLAASTEMIAAAKKLGVDIKLLIGPGTGHKFHPDSYKEFMAFHQERSKEGRPGFPGSGHIRFTTCTLKYNECDWLVLEEMLEMYKPATVEARLGDDGVLKVTTENVAVLRLSRDVASTVEIDGTPLPLRDAADGLLPDVYFDKGKDAWFVMDYNASKDFPNNPDLRKRRDLQGPIDDAFTQPFVCVRGTGEAWSAEQNAWAEGTLDRFEREFDKWMRGRIPVVKDGEVTEELIAEKNLILFGDPGSNAVLRKIVEKLPVEWTKDALKVGGKTYDPKSHGVSLIYPNPLNPRRYVVINSGHTFHEKDFKSSNAWLFPRLGDIAVQRFSPREDGGYDKEVVWAALFNPSWRLVE